MPRMRILPTTEAEISYPFTVRGDEQLAVRANGLAGAEEVVVQMYDGVDFVDMTDDLATLTAAAPATQITASGMYRLRKTATAGMASAIAG